MEKMKDPNIIDYCIINWEITWIIAIETRYQIDFGKPGAIHMYFKKIHVTFDHENVQKARDDAWYYQFKFWVFSDLMITKLLECWQHILLPR